MSFGFSPSDVLALTKLAYDAFQGAKQACGEHKDLEEELSCLISVLDLVRSESSDPDSLLNKGQAYRRKQLHKYIHGCMKHVKRIGFILEKYNGLSEEDRSVTQLWTKFRFGTSRTIIYVAEIRRRICSYTSSIQIFLQLISLSSQSETAKILGKLCETIETHVVKNKPRKEESITTRNSSGREGTVSTNCSTEEKIFWKSLRRDLEKSGHKNKTIRGHKDLILKYVTELSSTILDDKEEVARVPDPESITEQSTQASATIEATETSDITTSLSTTNDQQDPENSPSDATLEVPSRSKQRHSDNSFVLTEENSETLIASEVSSLPEVENPASHPHFSFLLEEVVKLTRSNQQYEQFLRSFNLDDLRSGAQDIGSSMPQSFPYTTDNILFSRGREVLNGLPQAQEKPISKENKRTFAENVRHRGQQQSDGEDIGFSEGDVEATLSQNVDSRYQPVHEGMYNESPSKPVLDSFMTHNFDPHERQDRKEMKARCSDEDEFGGSTAQEEVIVDSRSSQWEAKPVKRSTNHRSRTAEQINETIIFESDAGWQYKFQYFAVKTWEGIQAAIVNDVHYASADNIRKGNFDLYGVDGEHVTPAEWESYIQPNMVIKMRVRVKPLVYSYTPVAYNFRRETHSPEHHHKATPFDTPDYFPTRPWVSPRSPEANIWAQPKPRLPKNPPRTHRSSTRSYSPSRRAPSPTRPNPSPPRSSKKQSSSSSSNKNVSINPKPYPSQAHRKHSSSNSQKNSTAKHTRNPPPPVRNSYSTSNSDSELRNVVPANIQIVSENTERAMVIREEQQESAELLIPENEKFLPVYENEKFLLTPEMMKLLGVRTSRRS